MRETYTSAAAGKKAAKDRIDYLKARSANNLHAAGRLMFDEDCVNGMRLCVLGSDACSDAFSEACTQYKGPDGVREWALERAQFGVLGSLSKTFMTFCDARRLEECGFKVAFTKDCRAASSALGLGPVRQTNVCVSVPFASLRVPLEFLSVL